MINQLITIILIVFSSLIFLYLWITFFITISEMESLKVVKEGYKLLPTKKFYKSNDGYVRLSCDFFESIYKTEDNVYIIKNGNKTGYIWEAKSILSIFNPLLLYWRYKYNKYFKSIENEIPELTFEIRKQLIFNSVRK